MDKFFERMEIRREKILQRESHVDKVRRINREHVNETHPAPGRHGPKVFEWVVQNGYRVRTSLTRAEADNAWDSWKVSQMRYNSIDNEWDVCSEWGNDFDGDDDDSDLMDHWRRDDRQSNDGMSYDVIMRNICLHIPRTQ